MIDKHGRVIIKSDGKIEAINFSIVLEPGKDLYGSASMEILEWASKQIQEAMKKEKELRLQWTAGNSEKGKE